MEFDKIVLTCPEDIPESIIEDFTSKELDMEVKKLPVTPYMSFEWAIPTVIVAYLFKPYLESFLKEAGKDHYDLLKKWLKKITENSRKLKVHTITSTGSEDKISSSYTQSKVISVIVGTKDDRIIKLLFDDTLNQEVWEKAIGQFVDLFIENSEKFPNDLLTRYIQKIEGDRGMTIYAIIDKESGEWVFCSDFYLLELTGKMG